MKTLLLMRHAKSSWADAGQADHDRPLNDRGRRDAPRMGRWLKQQGLLPDLVLSSNARRAVETAQAVIDASGFGGEWRQTPELYEAEPEAYFEVLHGLPDALATVLVVAHNPGTEEMIGALTGEEETMPTGAVAHLTLALDRWHALSPGVEAQLAQVARPRELE